MVILELEFLKAIGRLAVESTTIMDDLRVRVGLEVCDLPFQRIVACSRTQRWTRDPFDRVIVGHAIATESPLLTKDQSIRRRFRQALW